MSEKNAPETITFTAEDLEPVKVRVVMGGSTYWLVEPDENAAIKYRNHFMKSTRMEDGKVVGMDGVHEGDSLLVSLCLYHADKEGNLRYDAQNRPDRRFCVPEQVVRGWKPRVVKRLADKVREAGDLTEQEETEEFLLSRIKEDTEKLEQIRSAGVNSTGEVRAKNGPDSTPDTSGTPGNTE